MSFKLKILTVIGTRPEAIKMAPLIRLLNTSPEFEHKFCSTGQHREMLNPVFDFFEIKPDFDLNIMKSNQSLAKITATILLGLPAIFDSFKPDWVFVHGDTSTCFAAALAAFYAKIKIAHVEAGLRTGNLQSPFPEEANRILTDRIADLYFVPTQRNYENLIKEGISKDRIKITGNTVIDALHWSVNKVRKFSDKIPITVQNAYKIHKKILLVTGHRRENHGEGFEQICEALKTIAVNNPKIGIVYPVHLNPKVKEVVYKKLGNLDNIYLTNPMEYPDFVYAMKNCWLILTDSGGIQEEAPSLGKPVLVMRDSTERPESILSGSVKLVGADKNKIVSEVSSLISNETLYSKMTTAVNPYGDGSSSSEIISFFSSCTNS